MNNFIEQHDYACWCGERRARTFCRQRLGRRFVVRQCLGCGTHRILPKAIATTAAAQQLYNDDQHTRAGFSPEIAAENVRRILRRLERVGIGFDQGSTVVDVGCSEGLLLETIRQKFGCRVVGVDVDERALTRARRDFPQVAFHSGLAQDLHGQLPLADAVIASAILEHVVSPVEFLEQLRRRLKPGGKLFLLTPNAASFHYRLARSWWRELLAIGEHVFLFTPQSLRAVAEKSGLHVSSLATDYDYLILPKLAFPRSLKAAAILPWSWFRTGVKAACMTLPPGNAGDILFASLEKK